MLWGRDLRHAILALAASNSWRVWSIPELDAALQRCGLTVVGAQSSKVLADALGHEVYRGRMVRIARGHYRFGRMAPRTRRRVIRRLRLTPRPAP
jgi:hypothetical protein